MLDTGRLPMLDRLRGEVDPEELLSGVAGLGRVMAHRVHDKLGITTLEDLEIAAHDGRLARLKGIGPKRIASIRDVLAGRLSRVRRDRVRQAAPAPAVAEILQVDEEYRSRARKGELKRIAPRRFNPANSAWLPILHTTRNGRSYTALFSNTARAHRARATKDWVVIYYEDAEHAQEGQCTVVTERSGLLDGLRVIRGREAECRDMYLGKVGSGGQMSLWPAA
jgi:hypothetical protein